MEDPATKRARVLGAGPRRKRETPAATAQQRAYKKPDRKVRLEPEVKEIREKCQEIKKLEEAVGLVDVLKANRNKPFNEAVSRVSDAEAELQAAKVHLDVVRSAGIVDMSDLDERQENLRKAIERHRTDINHLYKKLTIDASNDGP